MDKRTFRAKFFWRYKYDSIVDVSFYMDEYGYKSHKSNIKLGDVLEAFVKFEEEGYKFEEEFHYNQSPWFVEISFLKIKECFLFQSKIKDRISVAVKVVKP